MQPEEFTEWAQAIVSQCDGYLQLECLIEELQLQCAPLKADAEEASLFEQITEMRGLGFSMEEIERLTASTKAYIAELRT